MTRFSVVLLLLAAATAESQILPGGLPSRWWRSPQMVERLGLTAPQQQGMDDVFQKGRLKLIDLTASLDKEEALLEPLVAAEQPDAGKLRLQIDRIAQARAELEKANAYLLLELRLQLKQAQWKLLESSGVGPRPRRIPGEPVPKRPR